MNSIRGSEGDRAEQASALIAATRGRWASLLNNLDEQDPAIGETYFAQLQDHRLRVSWKAEVRAGLEQIFDGVTFRKVLAGIDAVHQRVLRGRVFVALHMHAGDGNVHTNIPVNSDHYEMLRTANEAVARIMVLARDLVRRTRISRQTQAESLAELIRATVRRVRPATGTPTGTVDFLDELGVLASAVPLDASGVATARRITAPSKLERVLVQNSQISAAIAYLFHVPADNNPVLKPYFGGKFPQLLIVHKPRAQACEKAFILIGIAFVQIECNNAA